MAEEKVKAKEKVKKKLDKVVINAEATDDGYYKGKIIKTGEKFVFDGYKINGKLPLWLKEVKKSEGVVSDLI